MSRKGHIIYFVEISGYSELLRKRQGISKNVPLNRLTRIKILSKKLLNFIIIVGFLVEKMLPKRKLK